MRLLPPKFSRLKGLAAPANVAAARSTSAYAVDVTWDAVTGATSYSVYRSTTSGSGHTEIGTSAGTSYSDTTGTAGTTYYYYVVATNGSIFGANSSEVSVATWAVFDTFTRANSGVTLGNAESGQAWNQTESVLGITSNQAYHPSPTSSTCQTVDYGQNNGWVEATLQSTGADLTAETFRIWAATVSNTQGYMLQIGNATSTRLFRRDGASTFVGLGTVYGTTITKGQVARIERTGSGSFKGYIDGTNPANLQATDTTYTVGATLYGIGILGGANARLDNVKGLKV